MKKYYFWLIGLGCLGAIASGIGMTYLGYKIGEKVIGQLGQEEKKGKIKTIKETVLQFIPEHVNTDKKVPLEALVKLKETLKKESSLLENITKRAGLFNVQISSKKLYSCNFSIVTPNIIATAHHCASSLKHDKKLILNSSIKLTTATEKRTANLRDIIFYSPRRDIAFVYVKNKFTVPKEIGCVHSLKDSQGKLKEKIGPLFYKIARYKENFLWETPEAKLKKGKLLKKTYTENPLTFEKFLIDDNVYQFKKNKTKNIFLAGDSGTGIYNKNGCLVGIFSGTDITLTKKGLRYKEKEKNFNHFLPNHINKYLKDKKQ